MPEQPHTEFRKGVTWNMVALGITACCGLALHFLIARLYGAAVLGVFNQVFAAYIFFSQFAVGGIHYATLKTMAENAHEAKIRSGVLVGALVPVTAASSLFAFVFYAASPWIGQALDSPDVSVGIRWATPGLFLFAINKVMLSAINGMEWMRAFAILQMLRPLCWLTALGVMHQSGQPASQLPVLLSIAEGVIFLGGLLVAGRWMIRPSPFRHWMRQHIAFGLRSFFAGVLVELNTRVDIIMLGIWMDDRMVGLYSFAAILAEGAYQVLMVLRNSYNPRLAQMIHAHQWQALCQMVQKGRRLTYLAMVGIGVVGCLGFPLVAHLASAESNYLTAWPWFAILISGIFLASGYLPFSNLLLQAGRPATHTAMITLVVCINIALNAVAIAGLGWGPTGAALATAMGFVFHAIVLTRLARRHVHAHLFARGADASA